MLYFIKLGSLSHWPFEILIDRMLITAEFIFHINNYLKRASHYQHEVPGFLKAINPDHFKATNK